MFNLTFIYLILYAPKFQTYPIKRFAVIRVIQIANINFQWCMRKIYCFQLFVVKTNNCKCKQKQQHNRLCACNFRVGCVCALAHHNIDLLVNFISALPYFILYRSRSLPIIVNISTNFIILWQHDTWHTRAIISAVKVTRRKKNQRIHWNFCEISYINIGLSIWQCNLRPKNSSIFYISGRLGGSQSLSLSVGNTKIYIIHGVYSHWAVSLILVSRKKTTFTLSIWTLSLHWTFEQYRRQSI